MLINICRYLGGCCEITLEKVVEMLSNWKKPGMLTVETRVFTLHAEILELCSFSREVKRLKNLVLHS